MTTFHTDQDFLDLRLECFEILDDLRTLPPPPTEAGVMGFQELERSLERIIDGEFRSPKLILDLMRAMRLVFLLAPEPAAPAPVNRAERRALARLQRRAS